MKNSLFSVLALFLQVAFIIGAKAQNLDYTKVGLMKADYDHRAVLYLNGSQSMATAALGNPTAVSTEYSEINDTNAEVWSYNNSKLYFVNNALVAYDLNDATLAVGQDFSTAFKVGNTMPTRDIRVPDTDGGVRGGYHIETRDYFPNYTVVYKAGRSRNKNYGIIGSTYLASGSTPIDGFSEVLFNNFRVILNIYARQ